MRGVRIVLKFLTQIYETTHQTKIKKEATSKRHDGYVQPLTMGAEYHRSTNVYTSYKWRKNKHPKEHGGYFDLRNSEKIIWIN